MGEGEISGTRAEEQATRRAVGYWRANTRLQVVLLVIWAVFGYVVSVLLADPLNELVIGGFPLGFWFAQQGTIVIFVILIFVYAVTMDRIDHEYDVHEEELGAARRRLQRRMQRRTTGETPLEAPESEGER